METLILQLYPSYISRIWKIDKGEKPLLIPRGKLRWLVTSIMNKVTNPILSTDIADIDRIYYEKIKPFQECWFNLVRVSDQTQNWKLKLNMNLAFYDRTLKMVNSDPIFANYKPSIIDTVEILKDYEMTIHSIIDTSNRLKLLQDALRLNEIDVNDFLNSLYGSFMALMCFWIIARNKRRNERIVPVIARISHDLAINLDSYVETLDVITNPEERDLMKRAEQWELQRHNLQNRSQ